MRPTISHAVASTLPSKAGPVPDGASVPKLKPGPDQVAPLFPGTPSQEPFKQPHHSTVLV